MTPFFILFALWFVSAWLVLRLFCGAARLYVSHAGGEGWLLVEENGAVAVR